MSFDEKKFKNIYRNIYYFSKFCQLVSFLIFLFQFSSAYSITMLFPFLPFMVEFLLPQIDPASIGQYHNWLTLVITLFALTGKYAGIIASSMFFGRFVGRLIFPSIHSSIHSSLSYTQLYLGYIIRFMGASSSSYYQYNSIRIIVFKFWVQC